MKVWTVISLGIVAVLALGQGCATPTVDVVSPIPGGVYTGSSVATFETYLNDELAGTDTKTVPQTLAFGPEGLLLTSNNKPIYIGYTDQADLTGMSITITVTGISTVQNDLIISYSAEMEMERQGVTLKATGESTETYTLQTDGSVAYTSEMVLEGTLEGDAVKQIIKYVGTFVPQA